MMVLWTARSCDKAAVLAYVALSFLTRKSMKTIKFIAAVCLQPEIGKAHSRSCCPDVQGHASRIQCWLMLHWVSWSEKPRKQKNDPKPNELISVKNMSLGQSNAAALPRFHAISRCDCTECLAGTRTTSGTRYVLVIPTASRYLLPLSGWSSLVVTS